MIAAEGRKAGVHLALALQDPTHKSIDLRIRRNTTSLAFRVKDPDASRVVLSTDGAEKLQERQFLVVLDKLVRGMAFAPSDEEIRAFLASRPVVAHPSPAWLTRQPTIIEGETDEAVDESEDGTGEEEPLTPEKQRQIEHLLMQNLSLRAIQRQVFGYVGGKAYRTVKRVQSESSTSSSASAFERRPITA